MSDGEMRDDVERCPECGRPAWRSRGGMGGGIAPDDETHRLRRGGRSCRTAAAGYAAGRAALSAMTAERDAALARVRELEAPPVVRPVVLRFAAAMERVLKRHDHKGGWDGESESVLLDRLKDEARELSDVVSSPGALGDRWRPRMAGEAIDVANFAMMIWDLATRGEVECG